MPEAGTTRPWARGIASSHPTPTTVPQKIRPLQSCCSLIMRATRVASGERILRELASGAVFASQSGQAMQLALARAGSGLTARLARLTGLRSTTVSARGYGYVAIVAQLVRAPVCGTGGRGFEPPRSPHYLPSMSLPVAKRSTIRCVA